MEGGKSSSNVTHCWACLLLAGGGGCCEGARAGGREEGGARGKVGAGDGLRGNRGAGVELRVDDGPNRDVVLWRWGLGPEAGAAVGAGVGMSG